MKRNVAIICLVLTSLTTQASKLNETQNYNDVKARVIQIISTNTGIPVPQISEDKNFVRDLKMDPATLENVRNSFALEIGSTGEDRATENINTVQEAINYVFIRQQ